MATQAEVNRVFSSVASRYDVMNDIMSFGLHRLWKRELCSRIVKHSGTLLDVAGGTGDIALRALQQRGGLSITVCDINQEMLNVGRKKSIDCGQLSINWVCASGECLPFPDNAFDYYTIAFGIRNIPDRQAALKEAYRVLKPCGRFLCLEFSPILKDSAFKTAYDLYSFFVIPKIGKIVAGDIDAYSYLVESIRAFPTQKQFSSEVADAGFFKITHKNVCGGIATLYSAWKV
ncbi:ubiquinone/menaquinone biosynthesis methyltransferase [Anaplasma phagocytophilum str. Norway variant1]|uniref:Ubiquinone/menaquinone biosynthesis C-methyltransferase UbiE n=1 Tax=Anaplasma phagocytophilum str. Norway variant1 TaxID=1392506 RepID=A0A7H9E0P1_ANAPH|nr:class I SAM-dependent methyltransferase [Anaplasma phagocytophilum]QLL66999.1 ubiquinone/menaquinone biosynthesis methyltransferase [Anaplasma phagocytophilum str. Norway variant1]